MASAAAISYQSEQKMTAGAFMEGVINSYSQVFFSDHRGFAIILVLISFIDPNAGLAGLCAVVVSNYIAYGLGFNRREIQTGLFGFNSLLVGLGIGYFYQASLELYFIVIVSSVLTLMFVTLFKGVLQKYGLPYLSIPFLFGIWTVLIGANYLEALGISQKGIYTINKLYGIGGQELVDIYEFFNDIKIEPSLKTYFTSISAIFFQFSVLAGIILSVGLLWFSRIAFLLSLYGFYTAYFFYRLLGGNIAELSYSYIGFNYILTAIAIGGFFIIPSKKSFGWLLILIPVVTLVTLSLSKVFAVFGLSIYSLPFNIVVLLFIYSLKFRMYPSDDLHEVYFQQNSPERNLYSYHNLKRFLAHKNMVSFSLPFHGTWSVSQGHEGEFTHKGEWRHAWDFVITDEDGKQYKNEGNYLIDYYCYGKSVLSPAAGIVEELTDDIFDNDIGKVNLYNNWGNTVVIKHSDKLYSSLSHLKPGSIKVKKGDTVKAGQKIGETGNSGRSPYPHLHVQFQSTPYIGSKSLDYPFAHYILKKDGLTEYKSFEKPLKDEKIMNIETNNLLKQRLNFIPGQILNVEYSLDGKSYECSWEVQTNVYNDSCIYDRQSNSCAWFVNDGKLLRFTQFTGDKSSVLYYFYLGFNSVLLTWFRNLKLQEKLPPNKVFRFPLISIQDFFAPFKIFLKPEFTLEYKEPDNEMHIREIKMQSVISKIMAGKELNRNDFDIKISEEKIHFVMNGKHALEAQIS